MDRAAISMEERLLPELAATQACIGIPTIAQMRPAACPTEWLSTPHPGGNARLQCLATQGASGPSDVAVLPLDGQQPGSKVGDKASAAHGLANNGCTCAGGGQDSGRAGRCRSSCQQATEQVAMQAVRPLDSYQCMAGKN